MSEVVNFPGLRKLEDDDSEDQVIRDIIESLVTKDADGYIIIRLDNDALQPEACWGGVIDPRQAIAAIEVIKLNFMSYILNSEELEDG